MSEDNTDYDYALALQLYHDLNGAPFEASPEEFAVTAESDSDEEEKDKKNILSANLALDQGKDTMSGSRTAMNSSTVTFDNQQAITIQSQRQTESDYFMPIINTFINMSSNQEWQEVNIAVNLQKMVECMASHYFASSLKNFNYKFSWDVNNVISDESSFMIFQQASEVLVSTELQVFPRAYLVATLFHILIHFHLNAISKDAVKLNVHGESFRQIMIFLNESLHIKITTSHKVQKPEDCCEFPSQWYRCSGICTNYEPFHGIVRCTSTPSALFSFFATHQTLCGGQFFKIFEIYRTNRATNDVEKKYLRNVRYMVPKPRAAIQQHLQRDHGHLKTKIPAREFCDLTDDSAAGGDVRVENLCEVINLDDTVSYCDSPTELKSYAKDFIELHTNSHTLEKCCFCKMGIGCSRLAAHYDNCSGYQQKIQVKNLKRFA